MMILVLICLVLPEGQQCTKEQAIAVIQHRMPHEVTVPACLQMGMQMMVQRAQSLDLPNDASFAITCTPEREI